MAISYDLWRTSGRPANAAVMAASTLSIFARYPEPGKAKTRLIPALGAEGAALVYRRLLERTVAAARGSGMNFEMRVTGGSVAQFHQWLGDDLNVIDQGAGDLGDKLTRAPAPGMVIGSDAPGLTAAALRAAAKTLENSAAIIGPASDGGYYLLGFREPAPFAFSDMEWSTTNVFSDTMQRFRRHGIVPSVLPELSDVDTVEDLADWPELLP